MPTSIRRLLTSCLLCLLPCMAMAEDVALTIDDGFSPPVQPQAAKWNGEMLHALAEHHVRVMFFPAGIFVDSPEGLRLVHAWSDAGHAVGNHTYFHTGYVDSVSAADFMDHDILRQQAYLDTLPGWCPRLRLPFLNEGSTPQRRDALLSQLAAHGYALAPVTITIDDWNYSQRFLDDLAKNPHMDTKPFVDAYLARLWQQAEQEQMQWRKTLGRDAPQVLLLHTNGLNATVLPQILSMFEAHGWHFIDPAKAFADPIYERTYSNDPTKAALPEPACR